LILIGVLAVVLCAVLYIQFGGSLTWSETTTSALPSPVPLEPEPDAERAAAVPPATDEAIAAEVPRKTAVALDNWHMPDLAAVVQYDPFAMPESFPRLPQGALEGVVAQAGDGAAAEATADQAAFEMEREQTQTQFEGLRQQGVRVIIKREDEYVAIIGDQEVHVGDEIDGFTVIAIDADGVRVAKDLSP
jgi:hypothetical protein